MNAAGPAGLLSETEVCEWTEKLMGGRAAEAGSGEKQEEKPGEQANRVKKSEGRAGPAPSSPHDAAAPRLARPVVRDCCRRARRSSEAVAGGAAR